MRAGEPLHPSRFLVLALLLGVAFATAVVWGVERLPWTRDSIYFETFFESPDADLRAAAFVLATPVTAWVLRSRICTARGWPAAKLASWIGFPGAAVFSICWWALSVVHELVHPIGDGMGSLLDLLLGLVLFPVFAAVFSAGLLPLTCPLAWASVLLLRLAAAGVAPMSGGPQPLQGSRT